MRPHQLIRIFALVLALQCDYGSSGNNFRNGYQLDYREIARQNKITEQILQNYLEKRLFPNNHRPLKAPTVWDILPRARRKPSNNIQDVLNTTHETLESGESERVSFYNDDTKDEEEEYEGRTSTGPSSRLWYHQQSLVSTMIYRCLLLSALILGTLSAAGPSVRSGAQTTDCPNCIEDSLPASNRWTMPLLKLGEKRYYLGIFFKANYFRATQYCRFHGMHLASITSQEENDKLEKYIKDFGLGHEHFWTSGTDLAEEGHFFWMSTGRPITFTNWNAGEPNNFQYENGEEENCLELWNRDGKGLKWNDSPCSFETYFVCEVVHQ